MKQYVIIDTHSLTEESKGKYEPRNLNNGQTILRVCSSNDKHFTEYIKYSEEDIYALNINTDEPLTAKFKGKLPTHPPFKDKFYNDGSRLYENIVGASLTITKNSTDSIVLDVPFDRCFLTEIEVVNGNAGDVVNFHLAIALGNDEYMPVYQHGYDVNITQGLYRRKSSYEAELTNDLWMLVEYTNNSDTDTTVGINAVLHEAKK